MILFFDLDGPLLDVSPRYVRLHHELLQDLGHVGMDPETYWKRKRARRSEEDVLAEIGAGHVAALYGPQRLRRIESAECLKHDCCWPWSLECLGDLAERATLVMVTARADRAALLDQLDALGLRSFFHEILSEPGAERVDLQKAALIRDYLSRHGLEPEGNWMIGDTEADIGAGKRVGLRTVAVLTGIRDKKHLKLADPDHLLADIRGLAELV
jgi:phosphoglycolate phosphatase-like HAD superfamily hydrolase